MDVANTSSILCSQGSGGSHGIALVSCNHFLISLETTVDYVKLVCCNKKLCSTNAPPELSEPAITSIRLRSITDGTSMEIKEWEIESA